MKISKLKVILILICISIGSFHLLIQKFFSNKEIESSDIFIALLTFFMAVVIAAFVLIFIKKNGYFLHYKKNTKVDKID